MSFPEWQHKFTDTKTLPPDHPGIRARRVTVTVGLHYLKGNKLPYFSATYSVEEQAKNGRWLGDCGGGPIGDDILRYWPELIPVVALHLSESTGAPMHAVSNALYWGGLSDYPDALNVETLARHLRTTVERAQGFIDYCLSDETGHYSAAMDFCLKGERARWQQEAADAVALLDRLIATSDD